MANNFKIIRGDDLDQLETRVRAFWSAPENRNYRLVGPPQVMGHYLFTQTLEEVSYNVD